MVRVSFRSTCTAVHERKQASIRLRKMKVSEQTEESFEIPIDCWQQCYNHTPNSSRGNRKLFVRDICSSSELLLFRMQKTSVEKNLSCIDFQEAGRDIDHCFLNEYNSEGNCQTATQERSFFVSVNDS